MGKKIGRFDKSRNTPTLSQFYHQTSTEKIILKLLKLEFSIFRNSSSVTSIRFWLIMISIFSKLLLSE